MDDRTLYLILIVAQGVYLVGLWYFDRRAERRKAVARNMNVSIQDLITRIERVEKRRSPPNGNPQPQA